MAEISQDLSTSPKKTGDSSRLTIPAHAEASSASLILLPQGKRRRYDPAAGEASMIDYAGMDPTMRRRLGAPGMRAFEAACDDWLLDEHERMLFLRVPSPSLYDLWRRHAREQQELHLDLATLLRISSFLSLHEELLLSFAAPRDAMAWLHKRNTHPLFNGGTPLRAVLLAERTDLRRIDRHIAGLREPAPILRFPFRPRFAAFNPPLARQEALK